MTGRSAVWVALSLLTSLAVVGCAAGPSPSPSPSPSPAIIASPTPTPSPVRRSPTPEPSPSPTTPRPLTLLLLGSDHDGLTDAILVVGIDPTTRRVSYASIPRDTIDVPLPDGSVFDQRKINGFYAYAAARPAAFPEGPGRATADAIGELLDIRIDHYARTTFAGFQAMVDAFGGIPVTLPEPVVDDFLQVGPNTFGIRFPAGKQTLDGRLALIFARIRHLGTDFDRQRRHQLLVTAAGLRLLDEPALAAVVVAAARSRIDTDFPLDRLGRYVEAMAGLAAGDVAGVVLGPRTYERAADCRCGYALAPKLDPMRAKAAQLFPWATQG
jgi:LCP family protein required for cell wall assembly